MSSSMAATDGPDDCTSVSTPINFTAEIIIIVVGANKTEFAVHREQLKKSPSFKSAMKEQWLKNSTITLPVDDPSILHSYLHFVYTSQGPETDYGSLANLYVCGERIFDSSFKNAVIAAIIRETHVCDRNGGRFYPINKCVDIVYAGILQGSLGRQLLVDMFSRYAQISWFDGYEYDSEFLRDLILERIRHTEGLESIYGGEITAEGYSERSE